MNNFTGLNSRFDKVSREIEANEITFFHFGSNGRDKELNRLAAKSGCRWSDFVDVLEALFYGNPKILFQYTHIIV